MENKFTEILQDIYDESLGYYNSDDEPISRFIIEICKKNGIKIYE